MNIHIYSLLEKINLSHKHYDIKALNNSFMGGEVIINILIF